MADDAVKRGCYCKPGEASCGTCERCGAAGHTRHFPGPVPYTGAWCDRCYRFAGLRHLATRFGIPLAAIALVLVVRSACTR